MTKEQASGKVSGGELLVKVLAANGVKRLSCVAGESYLAVLDALVDAPAIEVITCRQEGGAAFMAESWGKLSGEPGICFVTRGPGACNASIGVHTAMQDSTPMILFMGQVGRKDKGREAFQEIDVAQVFGGLAKWATEIDDAARIPEIVNKAFSVTVSGRPGPVVIGLPEDMLTDMVPLPPITPAARVEQDGMSGAAFDTLKTLLADSVRPVAIIGGSGWTEQGIADFESFARACHMPVTASFRRQDLFDHRHGNYVGELGTGPNPKLLESVRSADLLLVIGARLDEICTQGYTVPEAPIPQQKLIHIHASQNELNKVYQTTLAVCADVNRVAGALAAAAAKIDGRGWAGWRDALRADYNEWTKITPAPEGAWNGADMHGIYSWLVDALPKDTVITTDAGNFSGWAQRYIRYGRPGRLLAPINGAMGYAVPSAIGAALAEPKRLVLGLCGDGGFMMTGQELATAAHHGAKPIIMVCNNNMYGTIRMHQQREYPGRVSATALTNPDFKALAESYGLFAVVVERAADFPAAFEAARAAGKCAVIEVRMDPRQITTNAKPSA